MENELSHAAGIAVDQSTGGSLVNQKMRTSRPSVLACGNVLQVNDPADNVPRESEIARYAQGGLNCNALRAGMSTTFVPSGEIILPNQRTGKEGPHPGPRHGRPQRRLEEGILLIGVVKET
ncbi:MAG: hypothetical protein GX335_10395 [Firmicutes bacterium]|nr:hypothetical protein [Bacillota bacterium]